MSGSMVPRKFFNFPNLPNLWEEMEDRMSKWMTEGSSDITVSEDDKNVYVEAHLPGLQSSDIDISINKNTLWIKGEKKQEEEDKDKKYYRRARTSFFYQVDLPSQVEENSEQANYKEGVLNITFKKIGQDQVRKISLGGEKGKSNKKS